MPRTKLLAASILASMALLGATAATQAASPVQQSGQVAIDQGSAAQSTQAKPGLVAQNDSGDRNGVEDNDRNDRNGVEDNDRDDRGQTGEHEGEHQN